MPDLGVVDAPAVEAVSSEATSTDSSTEVAAQPSTEIDGSGTEGAVDDLGTPEAGTETPGAKGDLRSVLKDPAKREALKAIDPSLPGLLRDALHGRESLNKEFPGGLKEAIEFKNMVHTMGGREGLEEVKQSADGFQNLTKLFNEGKREFVQELAASPEAFSQMVPIALEQFAQLNPENYEHIMSRVMINTFDGAGLSNTLKGLLQTAGDGEKAGLQRVLDYVESFRAMASKVPEKKIDPERQKLDTERQAFQKEKVTALVREVDKQSISHRDSIIAREIKPFGEWETMDQDRKDAVSSWISQRIGKTLNADKTFLDKRNRLITSGDREGLAKLEQAKLNELVPKLVPGAAKVFGVTLNKQTAKPTGKPGTQTTRTAPKGVVMVREQPKAIDRRRTTPEMIFKNQAYTPSGQLVQWEN